MSGYENYGIQSGQLLDPDYLPHFLELAEDYPDEALPLLDQKAVWLKNLTPDQQHWRDFGYVIKRNFISSALIDEYAEFRNKLNVGDGLLPDARAHLWSSVIRDLCCSRELHYLLVDLLGEEMGLHFTLSGYKSTQRGWHQDDYLNPGDTMARYVAVWMAMGDIHPDSGPFQFIPGSHKWPCLRGDKVKAFVKPEIHGNTHEWATVSEYFVNKAVEKYMKEMGSETAQFDAKRGDILVWHAKMMHRGSVPGDPDLSRPALIGHYAAIRNRRHLRGEINRHRDGGYFWEDVEAGDILTPDRVSRQDTSRTPSRRMTECAHAAESAPLPWARSALYHLQQAVRGFAGR
jgi:hypothetical protein